VRFRGWREALQQRTEKNEQGFDYTKHEALKAEEAALQVSVSR